MTINEWQSTVDNWIKSVGVKYFDELTNTVILAEEVGESSRLMARVYGQQSFKKPVPKNEVQTLIGEEISDIIFVLTCLANQMNIDLTVELQRNIRKKTTRDIDRHKSNPKLKDD